MFLWSFKKHDEIGFKWDKSLLALTFVDALPVPRQERKPPHFDSGTFFLKKKEDWVRELKRHLLPKNASKAILIHSTTEHSTVSLPNGRDRYAPLWDDIVGLLLQQLLTCSWLMHCYRYCLVQLFTMIAICIH